MKQIYFLVQCEDATVENTIEIPQETCNMEPLEECKNITTRYKNNGNDGRRLHNNVSKCGTQYSDGDDYY